MDFTTVRILAHMEAVFLLLLVLMTVPMLRVIYIRLDSVPLWPLMAACAFGILWFVGLSISTGTTNRIISREGLIPALAVTEFACINFGLAWYALVLYKHIRIERPHRERKRHDGGIELTGSG